MPIPIEPDGEIAQAIDEWNSKTEEQQVAELASEESYVEELKSDRSQGYELDDLEQKVLDAAEGGK